MDVEGFSVEGNQGVENFMKEINFCQSFVLIINNNKVWFQRMIKHPLVPEQL